MLFDAPIVLTEPLWEELLQGDSVTMLLALLVERLQHGSIIVGEFL